MADGGEKDNGWQILEKQRWADSKEKDKGGQTVERWTKVGRRWREGQRWADGGEMDKGGQTEEKTKTGGETVEGQWGAGLEYR